MSKSALLLLLFASRAIDDEFAPRVLCTFGAAVGLLARAFSGDATAATAAVKTAKIITNSQYILRYSLALGANMTKDSGIRGFEGDPKKKTPDFRAPCSGLSFRVFSLNIQ